MTYRLTITYDGTNYVGWQIQPDGPSIQGTIEHVLTTLLKTPTRLIGSGRTDSGVHAEGQVAHFKADQALNMRAINGMLPYDIRVLKLEHVPDTFHAQYSAKRKTYHYNLWLEQAVSPFVRPYRHHVPYQVDLELLNTAAQKFVGTHDFATFANVGSSVTTTVRTIHRIDIVEQEGGVRLEFEGGGFLYKMVRNIVGTLLEVATGKRPLEEIDALFAAKDRRAAGIAAPARGLFLMEVCYDDAESPAAVSCAAD